MLLNFKLRNIFIAGSILLVHGISYAKPAEEVKVGAGVYEIAYGGPLSKLWVATSQDFSDRAGGALYQVDPESFKINRIIKTSLKPFGLGYNHKLHELWAGNAIDSSVTKFDALTGKMLATLKLDNRPATPEFRPLHPREIVIDEAENRIYVTGVGTSSVLWVIDGKDSSLMKTIEGLGPFATGIALAPGGEVVYVTNEEGYILGIRTSDFTVISRVALADDKLKHGFLNVAIDPSTHRAFITDNIQDVLTVYDTRSNTVINRIKLPSSLAVLFNSQRSELYVTHRKEGTVSIIDTNSLMVKKTLKAPPHPNSLALSEDGNTLYVSVKQKYTENAKNPEEDYVLRFCLSCQ